MINNEAGRQGFMGDATPAPSWLTDPVSIAKWASISDAERSDWARAHGSAAAGAEAARAAEAAGQVQQHAQADAMQKASSYAADVSTYLNTRPAPWYSRKGIWIAGGAGALVLFFAFRKPARAPATFHKRVKKSKS